MCLWLTLLCHTQHLLVEVDPSVHGTSCADLSAWNATERIDRELSGGDPLEAELAVDRRCSGVAMRIAVLKRQSLTNTRSPGIRKGSELHVVDWNVPPSCRSSVLRRAMRSLPPPSPWSIGLTSKKNFSWRAISKHRVWSCLVAKKECLKALHCHLLPFELSAANTSHSELREELSQELESCEGRSGVRHEGFFLLWLRVHDDQEVVSFERFYVFHIDVGPRLVHCWQRS